MTKSKAIDIRSATNLNDNEKQRINRVVEEFEEATGSVAKYVIKSPGRINLIGDHVDYHGFSVLPMAIENSIIVCVSTSTTLPAKLVHELRSQGDDLSPERKQLIILNANQQLYSTHQCEHSFSHGASLDQSHRWYNYVLCGYHGVLSRELLQLGTSQIYEHAKSLVKASGCLLANDTIGHSTDELDKNHLDKLNHMIVYVESDLPPASGLSSSSALVCASAIATHLVLKDQLKCSQESETSPYIDSESLAEDCAKFEHLVGTHGGGMDQAVILTAQNGYAKHVEFIPNFKCNNVYLPKDVVWLVSHCGESYPKAETSGFNSRVLETKLAAALILKKLEPSSPLPLDYTITLCKVKDQIAGYDSSAKEFMSTIANTLLNGMPEMSFDEVSFHLGLKRADLISRFRTSEDFLTKSGLNSRVCLLKRCRHVFEESDRVKQFKLICETTRNPTYLGKLMTESHISLRDDYECSHPALDNLVKVALKGGALGARLTGAGWGGCIVSLVESDKADQVMSELKRVSKFTFRTEPQSGASIIKITQESI